MSRLYLTEHRTSAGRFGLVAIHAREWAEAEAIARRIVLPGASPLVVVGYQDGDWDDSLRGRRGHGQGACVRSSTR